MILDEYLENQDKYEKKYGCKTIVFMEVGMFYELYGVNNSKEKLGKVSEIADLLNIQMSRKNKSIIENSRNNPLMAGVPNHSVKKYISILLNHNWTVVLIEQRNKGNFIERIVSNIYSPGTSIECNEQCDTNNLLSIYIENEEQINTSKSIYMSGVSIIDVSTGKNIVYQTNSFMDDKNMCLDEIYRFINIHNPREIIIYMKNMDISENDLLKYLEIENRNVHINRNDLDTNVFKLSYQNQFLERIFPDKGLLSVIEYLDLERLPYAIISYLFLLRFANEHNSTVIEKIHKPIIWDKNNYLLLSHSSIYQLNLVSSNTLETNQSKYTSLFNVLNNTQTVIGKRLLKERLLNPIIDTNILNKRYDYLESVLQPTDKPLYLDIDEKLSCIRDIERLQRKISLKLLHPCDYYTLDVSYTSIINVITQIKDNDKLKELIPNDIDLFYKYVEDYRSTFDLNEIVKYNFLNITNSFYKEGVNLIIDNIQKEINKIKTIFSSIIKTFSKLIDEKTEKDCLKLECNEHCGYFISLTPTRCKKLKESLKKIKTPILIYNYKINPDDISFDNRNSAVKLVLNLINEQSQKLLSLEENIKKEVYDYYLICLDTFYKKYNTVFKSIIKFVGEIDFITNNAKNVKKYKYCRPVINNENNDNDNGSFLRAKSIRHPIIEQIEEKLEYVSNDICLGYNNSDGILLYGVNASGKSSLMKSIGLSVIMAQSGMFVPCQEFEYKPYHNIYTRISNNDNIFKGQSTFAVEMSELRSILKRANNNSLVLGDELCSGTEWISGQSIVAAGIIYLAKKNASFIFATHMHQLVDIDEIKELDNVHYKHLKVLYDYETSKLVYDRKITDGVGSSTYGLEVCKAMDLEPDFLDIANNIRNNYFHKKTLIDTPKTSHFNNTLYIDLCKICGKAADDVHHIKHQSDADSEGFIGVFHKNTRHNLVALCKKCHNDAHSNKLDIKGYTQTSNGIELDFKSINPQVGSNDNELHSHHSLKKTRKKVGEEQQVIVNSLKNLPNINKTRAMGILKTNHNIHISTTIISKIWNNEY